MWWLLLVVMVVGIYASLRRRETRCQVYQEPKITNLHPHNHHQRLTSSSSKSLLPVMVGIVMVVVAVSIYSCVGCCNGHLSVCRCSCCRFRINECYLVTWYQ